MKAIQMTEKRGPEGLVVANIADPIPGPGQVRVRIHASALNRADLLQTLGVYPVPPGYPADIPGLEYAGEVESVGPATSLRKVGDRVMGITGGGAFAEYLTVHERETIAIPDGMPFESAAAIPEAFLTAYDALEQASFKPGEHVLIHAVTSGVGTAGIQMVKVLGGEVLGTGRNQDKLERCKSLGLTHFLKVESGKLREGLQAATRNRGPDVVLDLVGGDYLAPTIEVLAPGGRIVSIGLLDGVKTELPLSTLMYKRARILGTVLRGRPIEEKVTLQRTFERLVMPHFALGNLKPVIGAAFAFPDIAQGFAAMSANATFGKVVVRW